MPVAKKNGYLPPPRTLRELRAMHKSFIRKVKAMSTQELLDSMVQAGIYTKSGKLTKHYGG